MADWTHVADGMPKAGVPILAAFRYRSTGKTQVIRAQWADRYTLLAAEDDLDCDYSEELDEFYVHPGWYETNEFDETHWKVAEEITHWMPLPRHPEATDG